MPGKELEIKVTWEDNHFFKMEKKPEGEDWTTVISLEENAHIASLVGNIKGICMIDFGTHLDAIMKEMVS